jgi:preprotein translocase subunit YajC
MNSIAPGFVLLQGQDAAAAANPTAGMMTTLIMFGSIFLVFYFLIIRPQSKKQKEMRKMIEALKKGDKIVTIGGIHGIVSTVKERTVIVKVDDDVKLEFSKSAVASVEPDGKTGEEKPEPASDKDKAADEKK